MKTRSTIDYKGAETVNICLIHKIGYSHTEAFREAAERVEEECRRRRICCKITSSEDQEVDLNIIFGSHIKAQQVYKFNQEKSLIINLERLEAINESNKNSSYMKLLDKFKYIDFCSSNVKYCQENRVHTPEYLYRPWHEKKWKRVINEVDKTWDACLIGSSTPRRKEIIRQLEQAGLLVTENFNFYACERDEVLSKSKICLNIHAYENNQTAEIWRLNFLATNQIRIISEKCEFEKDEENISDALTQVNYNDIAKTVIECINNENTLSREKKAKVFYEITKEYDQAKENHTYPENITPKPSMLNIGCGNIWQEDALNIDIKSTGCEDLILDISNDWENINRTHQTKRFGEIHLNKNGFDAIEVSNVLGELHNLKKSIINIMRLLKPGGWLYLKFAHQNSLEAWDNPNQIRGLNEHLLRYLNEKADFDLEDMRATPKWIKFQAEDQLEKINTNSEQQMGTVESLLVKRIVNIKDKKDRKEMIQKIIEERKRMGTASLRETLHRSVYTMIDNSNINKKQHTKIATVSLLTPTFGARFEYLSLAWKWILEQSYPKELMEWVILTDTNEEANQLKAQLRKQTIKPQMKINIQSAGEKLYIGAKRNLLHKISTGDILINIDDDDYYFNDRVSHAVEKLTNGPDNALELAGCRYLPTFFTDDQSIWISDPGKNKACAGSFAYKRSLIKKTWYPEKAQNGEEIAFTQNWEIPIIELDPFSTMICVAHQNNTFDKKQLRTLFGDKNQEIITTNGIKYKGTLNFFKTIKNEENSKAISGHWQNLYLNIGKGRLNSGEMALFEEKKEQTLMDKLAGFGVNYVTRRNKG